MKGNILVLTNSITGLHTFRKEVMKAIVEARFQLYISAPGSENDCVQYFKEIGCKIIKTNLKRRGMNPIADFKLMLNYRRIVKRLKPIAVLSYTIKPNIYGGMACRLCGVPQLANVTGLGDAIENGGWLQKLTTMLYTIGIGKARQIFFQNATNRNFFIRIGIADERSIQLPGSGVNLLHHVYQGYPEDGITKFLYISRVIKDKGAGEFLEMAEIIKAKYPKTEFQIVGWIGDDYKDRVDDLVNKGILSFLGSTSDVRPYLKRAHCTILPSYHEGMSNVNLESAANGRPVITTNVPGCRETVEDGVTGFLVEPRSTQSLADAVERFINLPFEQKVLMGKEGRRKVEREFDRQIVVDAYLNEIEKIYKPV